MVIERFTTAVKYMRHTLKAQCAAVTASILTLDENGADRQADDVRRQLARMAKNCQAACDAYNKLRSLIGELEQAAGVANPTFYVKSYTETGVPEVFGGTCNCGRVCSVVDLAAFKPANKDFGPQDRGAAETEKQGRGESDKNSPQDDSENLHAGIIYPAPAKNKSSDV